MGSSGHENRRADRRCPVEMSKLFWLTPSSKNTHTTNMKKTLSALAGASLLALVLATQAIATPISGSISFTGTPNFDATPISGASAIMGYNSARVAVGQQTGTYATVADLTAVVFSPFAFSPATQAVVPLWSFSSLGLTYSFSTSSMVAMFNAPLNIWNFGGNGVLSATGYDDTVGSWNFSAGQIGQSFYFGSAAAATAASVPDTGMTLALLALGLGLIGLKAHSQRTTGSVR